MAKLSTTIYLTNSAIKILTELLRIFIIYAKLVLILRQMIISLLVL